MTDSERDLELVTAAAVIPPPRRWVPQGLPPRAARNGSGNLRLNYRPAQPGLQLDGFSLNTDPPPEAAGSALMQGLADHAAVVAPLSAIERGSTIGDEGPINEAFLSTPVVRLIAGAHYILRSAVLVPAGGLLYLNGATISDLGLILLSPGARIADAPRNGELLHFGGGLTWRADGAHELADLPAGQVNQPYESVLQAAGGTPPYTWNITGTLPPGLMLEVPQNWQAPLDVGRYIPPSGANFPSVIPLTASSAIAAGSRLLLAVLTGTTAATAGEWTDAAGNLWQPYAVSGLSQGSAGMMLVWQCFTTDAISAGQNLAMPATAGPGTGGGGWALLLLIRGAVSLITSSRRGQASSGNQASLNAPIGDPGQMVITWLNTLLTAVPVFTPDSGTVQIGSAMNWGNNFQGIAGYNSPGAVPAAPAASWGASAAWIMASVQLMVGGTVTGPGIGTFGDNKISGTPTTPGSYPVVLTVTDQTGLQDSAQMVIVIAPEPPVVPPPPSIITFDLPPGTVGVPYTAGLAVAGGVPPWTWGAIGLAAGLSLDPATGIITGSPTTAGTFPVTITVADANGAAAVASFEVDISPAPAPPPGP